MMTLSLTDVPTRQHQKTKYAYQFGATDGRWAKIDASNDVVTDTTYGTVEAAALVDGTFIKYLVLPPDKNNHEISIYSPEAVANFDFTIHAVAFHSAAAAGSTIAVANQGAIGQKVGEVRILRATKDAGTLLQFSTLKPIIGLFYEEGTSPAKDVIIDAVSFNDGDHYGKQS